MPVVDEGTFSLFISQCTNLPDDVEDPTRRLRVLVANNPHISSLAAQILLKDYSIQLPDAEFNALCNRLEISEIKRLVEDTVNALGIPAQADAAKTLLEKLAQNERIKKQLNEQANHTEQTAYFRLYYGHTEAQEIARDILQVTTPALLDRLCNCQQHANIRMAARLKLDAARLTLNEHADNIAQLAALAQNTQDITAPIDREAQCLGTVVKKD